MSEIKHIGIFDSGIGGLSVANIFLSRLPGVQLTYLGDNAYFPYGELDRKTILRRLDSCIGHLRKQGCDKIIIACNTASIIAEESEMGKDDSIWLITRPVLTHLQSRKEKSLSIYATTSTVNSGYYQKALDQQFNGTTIRTFARPDLVEAVEHSGLYPQSHEIEDPGDPSESALVLLACTHFHYLKPVFKRHFQDRAEVLDSAEIASGVFLQNFGHRAANYHGPKAARFLFTANDTLPDIATHLIRRFDARAEVLQTLSSSSTKFPYN